MVLFAHGKSHSKTQVEGSEWHRSYVFDSCFFKGRSENAYSGWTHLAFNVQAENPGEYIGMSGFKWEKLWEGIESSRDMSEADELVCVYSIN